MEVKTHEIENNKTTYINIYIYVRTKRTYIQYIVPYIVPVLYIVAYEPNNARLVFYRCDTDRTH